MKNLTGGAIWKAKKETLCRPAQGKGRRVVVEKGELVEFRYQCDAHFRTREDLYLVVTQEEFLESFEYVGRVFHEVWQRNNNKMSEIIDARLYNEEGSVE